MLLKPSVTAENEMLPRCPNGEARVEIPDGVGVSLCCQFRLPQLARTCPELTSTRSMSRQNSVRELEAERRIGWALEDGKLGCRHGRVSEETEQRGPSAPSVML